MADERPLTGTRIISLAEQYPGPFATLVLSDLGAEVIQVERPDGGDPARRFVEFHEALNRGKHSVALDLKEPDGVAGLLELVADADALLEGYRPGVMDRLGLSAEVLREANPGIVLVSISGFGQDGPYRLRPAHDLSYRAMTGHLAGVRGADDLDDSDLPLADLVSGLFGVIAVLTGIAARRAGKPPSVFDVSMFDAMVSAVTSTLGPRLNGASESDLGRDPGYGLYRTADDRLLSLSIAFEDRFWDALCRAADLPQHVGVGAGERVQRRAELREELAAVVATAPLADWEERFADGEVPFGAVAGPGDVEHDAHVRARQLIHEVGGRRYIRQPIVVDGARLGPRSVVPRLGQDTVESVRRSGPERTVTGAGDR